MKIYEYHPQPRGRILRAVKAGNTTAGDISRFCKIPVQTVRKALRDLEKRGYIRIKIEGKKQTYFAKSKKQAFLGIHVNTEEALLCLYSTQGDELCPIFKTESISEAVLSTAEKIMEDNEVSGIGISLPSTATFEDGLLIPTQNVGNINISALAEEFKAAFSLPVFVGTDALCGGIYYMTKTPAAEKGLTVFVSAGESIDSAIFEGGKLISGACGLGGLFGHMSISRNAERCYCGNRGCLESYCSLKKLYDGGDITLFGVKQARSFDDIKTEYQNGETETVRQLESMATELAAGLANIINLLNPSHLIVGGDFVKIGDLMSAPLHSVIKQRIMPESFNALTFAAITETDAAAAGAALGAFEVFLNK